MGSGARRVLNHRNEKEARGIPQVGASKGTCKFDLRGRSIETSTSPRGLEPTVVAFVNVSTQGTHDRNKDSVGGR